MAINKETIHELVEVFYQPPFKTFYINSEDGKDFVKPLGVFVSLGITTSIKVLSEINEVLSRSTGITSRLVEIKSQKVGGQFMNLVLPTTNIAQYDMETIPAGAMGEKEAKELIETMYERISGVPVVDDVYGLRQKISRLTGLIEKLDNPTVGWENHMIQETDTGDYRVFHKKVNYHKSLEEGAEYRIGIYVTET